MEAIISPIKELVKKRSSLKKRKKASVATLPLEAQEEVIVVEVIVMGNKKHTNSRQIDHK